MTDEPLEPQVAQSFSYENAKDALGDMYDALPKAKRMEFVGHLNEVGMYMQIVNGYFSAIYATDAEKARIGRLDIREVLKEQIAKLGAANNDNDTDT